MVDEMNKCIKQGFLRFESSERLKGVGIPAPECYAILRIDRTRCRDRCNNKLQLPWKIKVLKDYIYLAFIRYKLL